MGRRVVHRSDWFGRLVGTTAIECISGAPSNAAVANSVITTFSAAPGIPCQGGPPSLSAFGILRTILVQHRYLTATLRFDHDKQIQATEEAR